MDDFKLNNTNDIATTETTQTANTPELKLEMIYSYECRYRRELYLKSGNAMQQFGENETWTGLVPFHNISQSCHNETQERSTDTTTSCNGYGNIPPGTKTAPQTEEVLARDKNSKEFFAIVLHSGQ